MLIETVLSGDPLYSPNHDFLPQIADFDESEWNFAKCYTVQDSCLEASSLFCKITQARNTSATGGCTHGLWTPDAKIYTAQIHISIPNRKSCKMYEDLSFLPKKWLKNAKSQTRDTQ